MAERSGLRALVVGAGATSNLIHLPLLAKLRDRGRLSLAIICDLERARADAARRHFGFAESCSDARGALTRSDIDLVYVFGTAQMHFEYGLQALAEGKHLFVEKPIAPGYAEAKQMAGAAQRAGRIAVGGHNRRFQSAMRQLRHKRSRWQLAEAVFHKAEQGKPVPFGARDWLWANGIHALDALLFLMGGPPSHLSAAAQDQCFSALLRWPDGAQAIFTCDNQAGARAEEYRLHAPGETAQITAKGLTIARDAHPSRPIPNSDGFAEEHEAFLAAVHDGISPPHALAELAPALRVAELIQAGHDGPVLLPAASTPLRSAQDTASVLVVQPRALQQALAPLLSHRLVAPEDVMGPRPDIVAAVMGRPEPLSRALLDRLPNLSFIAVAGLSLHRMEPGALEARGITLANATRAYADSVAEFALALAILGRRRAFLSHRLMRKGAWGSDVAPFGFRPAAAAPWIKPLAARLGLQRSLTASWQKLKPVLMPGSGVPRDLTGASVGLVGWGANACAFTCRLIASGARVIVWSENADPVEIRAAGAHAVPLCEVLAAEIVSVHRALTPQTRHCLKQAELEQLRSGTILINVARGALIEPNALLERLRRGDIFACLDVFEEEPLPRRHPLRRLPNVFLTSHIAGGSPDMHQAAAREAVARLCEYLGQPRNADRRNVSR